MKIAIIGVGYVGLVSGVCLADFGMYVTCADINTEKVNALNNQIETMYEPGLQALIEKNINSGRLHFTTDIKKTIQNSDVIFITVGTPAKEDGSTDLTALLNVAKNIGLTINEYKTIVIKSTVPVGTNNIVRQIILDELKNRNETIEFDMVSNPEFLREGKGIYDFTHPDRILIGSDSESAINTMKKIYEPLYIGENPYVVCDIPTAEIAKYACNTFLAMKIAFVNEMAAISERCGGNIKDITNALGKDGRISNKFLNAGPGFGGSCFPKDLLSLSELAKKEGLELPVLQSIYSSNEMRKHTVVDKLKKKMGSLSGKSICILGVTFKAETDDVRCSSSITVIKDLLREQSVINVYDPKGLENIKKEFSRIQCFENWQKAAAHADAILILTEWNEFRNIDPVLIKQLMDGNVFYDSRNLYKKDVIEKNGLFYIGTGI